MLDWLVVGGGVHGTCVSRFLVAAGRGRDRIAVLDPHELALAAWVRAGGAVGMDYLRSPMAHHIDVDDVSLLRFAAAVPALARFAAPSQRPARELFEAHSRRVVERHALAALRIRGLATRLVRMPAGWRLETTAGTIDAARVVLALGPGDCTFWPPWALAFRRAGGRIAHVLDSTFRRDPGASTVVIGGGISAAQLSLSLAAGDPGCVVMLARHRPRLATQDAELGWLEGNGLAKFTDSGDAGARRGILAAARRRGSMPADVAHGLLEGHAARRLELVLGAVDRVTSRFDGKVRVEVGGRELVADRLVLATGFAMQRPGGSFVDRAIRELGLPVARCGYPIVNGRLEWSPGLHVTGPLAELQLGPLARSIGGGRVAATMLARVASA
jgi:cation diffusion facilitator CzcD-associated flavoprotein CzcO